MADDASNLNNMKIPTANARAAGVLYGMVRTKKKKKKKENGEGKSVAELENEDKQKLFHADIRAREGIFKTALKMHDREHATGEAIKLDTAKREGGRQDREHATGESLKLDRGKKTNARRDTKARQTAADKREEEKGSKAAKAKRMAELEKERPGHKAKPATNNKTKTASRTEPSQFPQAGEMTFTPNQLLVAQQASATKTTKKVGAARAAEWNTPSAQDKEMDTRRAGKGPGEGGSYSEGS